jgi:hypothetical protein
MAKSTHILVAAVQLVGAAGFTLQAGEEFTDKIAKKLGIDDAEAGTLKGRGVLVEVEARTAEPVTDGDAAALEEAIARAEKAEADLKAANDKLADLQKQIDAAQAKAAKA